jgi:hypothetical protein
MMDLYRAAEAALTALTDECCGSCAHGKPSACPCRDQFWPAIETLRELQKQAQK